MFAAFALCRFLGYVASLSLFGASAMLALSGSQPLSLSADARLRGVTCGAAVMGLVAVLCLLPLQAATIADDWRAMLDAGMLSTVAFQTQYGQAWCLRALTAVGVLAVMLHARPGEARLRTLITGVALLPLGLTGHAAMDEGWPRLVHAMSDILHCLAAAFWLGALPVFLAFLARGQDPIYRKDATRALLRFSNAGHIAVAVLLISGAVNAFMIFRSATPTLASGYTQLLMVKILLAGTMVGLAIINRYRWIRRIRDQREAALRHIRRNTLLELWAGAAILMLVGLLGLLAPS